MRETLASALRRYPQCETPEEARACIVAILKADLWELEKRLTSVSTSSNWVLAVSGYESAISRIEALAR